MRRTTVVAEDTLLLEAQQCARREGISLSALFEAALREYLATHARRSDISFAGVGRSGDPHAANDVDRVRGAVDPATGWSPRRRPVS